jgi:uncharacterized membrane protein YqhA
MNGFKRGVETAFETFLFNSRLIVILAVLGSLTSSVLMFVRGAMLIAHAAVDFVKHIGGPQDGHDELSVTLISSVDSFLFATVLLIFAMGIYELFISKIDPASRTADSRPNWLQIHSLDDLKSAIGKVILMILIVRLFESAVKMKYDRPLDLLYLGLGVVFVAVALYLQHLGHKKHDHGEAHDATYGEKSDAASAPAESHGEATYAHPLVSPVPHLTHSTATGPTHVALPLPPPPPLPSLPPTIAHPREHPLPQAHGPVYPAYPPPPAPGQVSPSVPPPPMPGQAQQLPMNGQQPQAMNGQQPQHPSMNAPPPWSQLGHYAPPRS